MEAVTEYDSIRHQPELREFLREWDSNVKHGNSQIAIFDPEIAYELSPTQKASFIKVFYHARGHFHDFLWTVGNYTDDPKVKQIVVNNILEEFGGKQSSHEQLYFRFANALGVDIRDELVTERSYIEPIREFNVGHLKWLLANDPDSQFAAFSAYERLDNLDYDSLYKLAEALTTEEAALTFFAVHKEVEHYDYTEAKIRSIWNESPEKVAGAFEFIRLHQNTMWRALSNAVLDA